MMRSVILALPLQSEVRQVIDARGERAAAELFELSPTSMLRALAGIPVSRGTIASVERGLERNDDEIEDDTDDEEDVDDEDDDADDEEDVDDD
jgi:hypothetical protein